MYGAHALDLLVERNHRYLSFCFFSIISLSLSLSLLLHFSLFVLRIINESKTCAKKKKKKD